MFELRVYGEMAIVTGASDGLEGVEGIRHLNVSGTRHGSAAMLTANVRSDAADAALAVLDRLAIPAEDIVLVRLDTIAAAATATEPIAIVWADILGQAHIEVRAHARYFVLMGVAGVVAAFAVVDKSAVLIVGAMAISPDLLPIVAACTGIVLRRPRLVSRGLVTLAAGLATVGVVSACVTGILRLFDWLPEGFTLGEISAAQKHISASTVFVALAAGVAGMVALETRANAAVGVAISVTTVPAVAYLGVALGLGQLDRSLSALWVLLANVALMVIGGTTVLAVQRAAAARSSLSS